LTIIHVETITYYFITCYGLFYALTKFVIKNAKDICLPNQLWSDIEDDVN